LPFLLILVFLELSRGLALSQQAQTSPRPVAPIPLAKLQSEAQSAATLILRIDQNVSRAQSAAEAVSGVLSKLATEIESRLTEDTKLLAASRSLDLVKALTSA
jgi:hypothetical protein